MAKKVRLPTSSKPAPRRPAWIGFAVTGFVGALAGGAISTSVRPRAEAPQPAPVAAAPTPPAAPADAPAPAASGAVPPPELILDLPAAKAALNLGNWSYNQTNWSGAIAYYREAAKRGFDNADVLTDLGNAYRFSNQPQKALEQYALAQKKNPAHETSLFNQGDVYATDLGDMRKGIDAWRKYLARFPHGSHREQAAHLIAVTEAHSGINTGNAAAASIQ